MVRHDEPEMMVKLNELTIRVAMIEQKSWRKGSL
jgi:hypothetical protein